MAANQNLVEQITLSVESTKDVQFSADEAQIINAVSPKVNIRRMEDGAVITVTDVDGVHDPVTVYDGAKGEKGDAGGVQYDSAQTLNATQKQTARTNISAASEEDVTDLKSAITFDESNFDKLCNLDKTVKKIDVTGWTNGRIISGSYSASNLYAYSNTYENDHNPVYFDDSVYEVGFCYFSSATNDPTAGAEALGSWITTSPATNSSAKAYYRLSIRRKDSGIVSTTDVSAYIKEEKYSDLVSAVKKVNEDIGIANIQPGTANPGYYKVTNGVISYVANSSSTGYVIDLTDYVGNIVNVLFDTSASNSTRRTALCDTNGVVIDSIIESEMTLLKAEDKGKDFYPTGTYKYLYVSFTTNSVTTLKITGYSAMGKDVHSLMIEYSPNTVYVDSANGSDSNNGISRTYAFATIQKAVDSGAENILVREGTYGVFSLSNKANVNISIDHYYDSFTVTTDEDNPKVVIDGARTDNNGIVLSQCSNIKISCFEVQNCIASGFHIEDCSATVLIDCVVHDIYKSTKDAVSHGYRFISSDCDCYNCLAYNIGTETTGAGVYHCDGFNIHTTGTVNLFNCKAYNCEDDGVSHHDACCGLIDGGEWYHCGKGGIASPTHGAKVNVQNVYSHDNLYGLYAGNDSAVTDRGNTLIANCAFKDNAGKDILANAYYKLIVMNCIFDTYQAPNITIFGQ